MIKVIKRQGYDKKYGGYSPEIFQIVPPKSSVLDLGCSTGTLANILTQKKYCNVIGIDIDKDSLIKASHYCKKVFKCDLDNLIKLKKLLNKETFDVIILGDVLEHLKNPKNLLCAIKKYLNPNGIIISSIPNAAFISMRIKFLFGDFSYNKQGGIMDEDHLRFFSFKTAKLLFEEAGYELRKIYGINIVKKRFLFLKLLGKIFPTLFAIHIIIIAKKKSQ